MFFFKGLKYSENEEKAWNDWIKRQFADGIELAMTSILRTINWVILCIRHEAVYQL